MRINILIVLIFFKINPSYSQIGDSAPLVQDQFPKKSGHLRMSSSRIDFGRMMSNEIKSDTIRLYNSGKATINFSVTIKPPPFIRINIKGTFLKPGTQGLLILTYEAFKKGDFGYVVDRIQLNTDDSIIPQKFITVTATIDEYFSQSVWNDTANIKVRIPEQSFNFGNLKQGEKVSHDFKIYNSGRRPVTIRKIKTDNAGLKAWAVKKDLIAGDSTIIHAEFYPEGKLDSKSGTFYVYMNNPTMPEVKFELSGVVTK